MQVEQIDREAAAEFLSDGPETVFHRNIRLGGVDKHPLIQAFARHRHQAREQVVGEIVAWLLSDASRLAYEESGSAEFFGWWAADKIKAEFGGRGGS